MTPNQRKEEVSKAYTQAIAAACGLTISNWSQDHDCLDVTLGGTTGRPKLDIQLKATSQADKERANTVWWQVSREHYEQMRAQAANPLYFVLLILPPDQALSVEHTISHILIRRCAYWVLMTGAPESDAASPTITIPKSQIFSPEQVSQLMDDARALKHLKLEREE